jgi:hypothetical protein
MGITRQYNHRSQSDNSYVPRWLDNDGVFLIGKCKGEVVEDVARDDPSYLEWIVDKADRVSDEDRETIEAALQFRNYRR